MTNVNLYRAIGVENSPNGYEALLENGITYSNNSLAQYGGDFDDPMPIDWGGYDPTQKVDGLPVFITIEEAQDRLAGSSYKEEGSYLPLIAHASLPVEYFTTFEYSRKLREYVASSAGLLTLRGNDCNNHTWPAEPETVVRYQQWLKEDHRWPDRSPTGNMTGEYYIDNAWPFKGYPLDKIRQLYKEASSDPNSDNPPDFTRYYTPSWYLLDGMVPRDGQFPEAMKKYGEKTEQTYTGLSVPPTEVTLADIKTMLCT